jgi:hypothetical protein
MCAASRKRWKMKSFATVTAAVSLVWLVSVNAALAAPVQAGNDSQSPAATSEVSYILAEFTQSLNAKKLKPGDAIKAEVSQDVLAHGRIVIPARSTLVGHVTEVKPSLKEDRPSRLGIVFDKVLLKHHVEVALRGVIHALAAPVLRRSNVDEADPLLPDAASGRGTGRIISNTIPAHGVGRGSARSDMSTAVPTFFPDGLSITDKKGPTSDFSMPRINNPSLSLGTRLGVFGIKGLSLIRPTSGEAPVIWSQQDNVKLDYGVQVLVRVVD